VTIRCPILIGRDDLLELVDRRLGDVAAGRGQFLLIAGEAGIGKTRFLSAIRQKAGALDLPVVVGSIAPQDQDVPAASVRDLARTMVGLGSFAEPGRALLVLLDTTVSTEHILRRQLVMESVDLILGAFEGPTMLSFEDLQWADELSLEIIGELARRSRDRPILLTADYRVEDVPPGTSLRDWRARLVTQRIAEEIRLQPLTRSETALVTTLILATGLPAPREVAAAVFERTDGIPLHIEELLGALSAEARADGKAIMQATVPETIDDAVLARMAHRSPEAQAVARAGAVIGRCFAQEVLAGIMDLPQEALDDPLRELADHMVLSAPGFDGGYYDFRHQLLRDVLYRTIPGSDRRRFHARAGEFGRQLDGASEIHASVHYERAGLRRQAYDAALIGAQEAAFVSAHREAFGLYRRAVANIPEDLRNSSRGELLEAYAEEAGAIEENKIVEQVSRDAAAAYLASGRPAKATAMMANILTISRREAGSLEERARLVETLMHEIGSLPPSADRDQAEDRVTESRICMQIDALALADTRPAINVRRETALARGDAGDVLDADAAIAILAVLEGDVSEGLDGMEAAAAAAQRAGLEAVSVTTYRNGALMAARSMEYGRATAFLAEGMRYADAIEQSHCMHMMGAVAALVAWAGADWDGALMRARQTIADHGGRRAITIARWADGYVALGRGDLDLARSELSSALQVGLENGSPDLILPALWGLAEVDLQADAPDLAMERCQDALRRAITVGERALLAPFVVTGVRAGQAAGRPEDAEAWLAACEDHCSVTTPVARSVKPALDHGRGLVAMAAGSTGVARQALEGAIAGWDGCGRIWESTWARLDLANCLTRSNRFADAVALATEARAIASRLDSPSLADRADGLLRMARGHAPTDEPWRPLTAREFAVARLITDGLTNGEIATELGIASKTASSHVEHILAKLGVSRRAEIAAWASRLEPSSPLR